MSSVMIRSHFLLIVAQIRGHLVQMLSRKNNSLSDIVQTLQEYHDNIDEDDTDGGGHGALQRSILQNLMEFLKSC